MRMQTYRFLLHQLQKQRRRRLLLLLRLLCRRTQQLRKKTPKLQQLRQPGTPPLWKRHLQLQKHLPLRPLLRLLHPLLKKAKMRKQKLHSLQLHQSQLLLHSQLQPRSQLPLHSQLQLQPRHHLRMKLQTPESSLKKKTVMNLQCS